MPRVPTADQAPAGFYISFRIKPSQWPQDLGLVTLSSQMEKPRLSLQSLPEAPQLKTWAYPQFYTFLALPWRSASPPFPIGTTPWDVQTRSPEVDPTLTTQTAHGFSQGSSESLGLGLSPYPCNLSGPSGVPCPANLSATLASLRDCLPPSSRALRHQFPPKG